MSRWRIAVIACLFALPVLVLIGVGSYYLWDRGLWLYVWWPLTASFGLAYFLAWRWQKKRLLLPAHAPPPEYWTQRDRAAWALVQARAESARNIPLEMLGEPDFYTDAAMQMARQLAQHYRSGAEDPWDNVTVPELLAVIELAAHDLNETVTNYLPAGHLMTIGDWKKAPRVTEWYQRASTLSWAASALLQPLQTAARYTASQFALAAPWQMLQQSLIDWFYAEYLQRTGTHLIELYSGRLRVGVKRYREVLHPPLPTPSTDAAPADRVTLILFGQVKAGKSSLANAILGKQRAKTDVLPETNAVTRYHLAQPDGPTLDLLDTVGYGHEGPSADDLKATCSAAETSDLLLLVLHARNPARAADAAFVERLHQWFADRPQLKEPPIIAVVSHIDLLTPATEWSPPYDWRRPKRLKEEQIHEAVLAVREQLGDRIDGIVPLCTAEGRILGIQEELLPTLAAKLGEARAVAMIRLLTAEADAGKIRKLVKQITASGWELLRAARR